MAIEQTGSVLEFVSGGTHANTGTVSTTITVPDDADFVVVGISGYSGTANYFSGGSMTFTKGGVDTAMTSAGGGADSDTGAWMGAMFYMVAPDTGTNKTLKWDWVGSSAADDNSRLNTIIFFKGVDQTTPVRDSDGDQNGSLPYTTPTLTAQTGDLILAWASGFTNGANGTIDSWSNLTLVDQSVNGGNGDGAWASSSPSGNTAVAASTGTSFNDGGIVAIVIQPAAGGTSATATPGVISTPFTFPAVSLTVGSTMTPGAISTPFTFPAATAQNSDSVIPAATSVAVALPTPSLQAGQTALPAALSVAVTLPDVTEQASHDATPATIPIAVTLPAATASGADSGTATPAAISTPVTFPQVSLVAGSQVTPAPIALVIIMSQVLATGPVLEFTKHRAHHDTLTSTIAHRVTLTGSWVQVQLVNLDATEPLYAFVSRTGTAPTTATAAADDSYTIPAGGVVTWRLFGVGFVVSLVGDGNAYSVVGYDHIDDGVLL